MLIDWLAARFARLEDVLETNWGKARLLWNDWYFAIWSLAFAYWTQAQSLVVFLYVKLYYLTNDGWPTFAEFIAWVYSRLRQVAVDWWEAAKKVLNEWWTRYVLIIDTYYGRVTAIILTYWTRLEDYVSVKWARWASIFDTYWDTLNWLVTGIANRIAFYVGSWWQQANDLFGTLWAKVKALVTDWYARLVYLVNEGWASLSALVGGVYAAILATLSDHAASLTWLLNDAWPWLVTSINTLQAVTAFLTNDLRARLLTLAGTWYSQLAFMMQYPAAWVYAYVEAYLWPYAEGLLAEWLGAVNVSLPPRTLPFLPGATQPTPGGGAPPGSTGLFIWPSANHTLSGYDFGPTHGGLDIAAPMGSSVWASRAGTIALVGTDPDGYGLYIDVTHVGGYLTRYAHLSAVNVITNQTVNQGQNLGLTGSTGHSTGPHLHFEIRLNNTPVNPWALLPTP